MRISDWSSDVCSSDLIADEDRPVVKTAVDLVVQGQLDVADAVAVHILGQLRIGIDLRNDERDSIVPVDVGNLDFGLQAVGDADAPGNRSLIEVPVRILRLEKANKEGVWDLATQEVQGRGSGRDRGCRAGEIY